MKNWMVFLFVAAMLAVAAPVSRASQATMPTSHAASLTFQCGSFKYGSDGLRPGPSHVTALRTTCRTARRLAFAGSQPGWHCRLVEGLLIKCTKDRAVVTYFGE